jgi:D-lactate dehydrogenase (cytochrome)
VRCLARAWLYALSGGFAGESTPQRGRTGVTRAAHVCHARPPAGRGADVRCVRDPDVLATLLEDAAHYPGGHAVEAWFPRDEAEVAAVVRGGGPILPIGAQSSLTGGATPLGDRLLALTRMRAIRARRADAIDVEPGVVLRDLLVELRTAGAFYPPSPTYDGATVGGTVGTNASGAATFKYGTTRDWVRALTIVLANGDVLDLHRGEVTASAAGHFEIVGTDGEVRRIAVPGYVMPQVPKLSAGYHAGPGMDLIDLFIGSEGTLGVVTSITLRILSPAPDSLVTLVALPDEAAALALAADLRAAAAQTWREHDPRGVDVAAIEYMDGRSLALLHEDGADGPAGVGFRRNAGAALLVQTELPAALTADRAAEELSRIDDATCDTAVVRLCRLLRRHGVLDDAVPALPGDALRRDGLFAIREAVPAGVNRRIGIAQRTIDPAIAKSAGDPIVPIAFLGDALARWRAVLERQRLEHAIWGHVADGNLHVNVLPKSRDDMARAELAQLEIGAIAIELGGSPMAEHGVGRNAVKQELLRRLYGDAGIAAMRAVKKTLDPGSVLAPGVLFPV